jgi:multisubunit Na+/H+ antiporter MnhC subunit
MSINLTLLIVMGALYACGIYLILERSLTRVLLGLMLLANATNLLILATGGYAGLAPFSARRRPGGLQRPPAAGTDPDVHRHFLCRDGLHARHHLPHLGPGPPG